MMTVQLLLNWFPWLFYSAVLCCAVLVEGTLKKVVSTNIGKVLWVQDDILNKHKIHEFWSSYIYIVTERNLSTNNLFLFPFAFDINKI